MSKIYYDSLLNLDRVEEAINELAESTQEKHKLWHIVDEMVHHHAMDTVLENLHKDYHQEFLGLFHSAPHDENLLIYLGDKIEKDIRLLIQQRIARLVEELLVDLRGNG